MPSTPETQSDISMTLGARAGGADGAPEPEWCSPATIHRRDAESCHENNKSEMLIFSSSQDSLDVQKEINLEAARNAHLNSTWTTSDRRT